MMSASDGVDAASYVYDALGRRVKRTKGTDISKFTHDGQDVVLDDENTVITTYQNGAGIDNKLSIKNGSNRSYVLGDPLGSTNGLADQSGAVTSSATYDSFGNQAGTLGTRYGYTGRERDDFTGLMYYRARMYDPALGRFISEDPIGFAGANINLYGYVRNNPLNLIDPLGLYDGPVNHLRDPFASEHWILNGSANTVSDLLALDWVARWAWTVGDYRCSNEDRLSAGSNLLAGRVFRPSEVI